MHNQTAMPIGNVLCRFAVPAFFFAVALATILVISRFTILPMLTAVNVGGVTRDLDELQTYSATLTASISELVTKRDEAMTPLADTPYAMLVTKKASEQTLPDVLALFSPIANAVTTIPDAVHLNKVSFDPSEKSVVLTGDIRGVGPQSMTLLAQLTEALRNDARIASLVSPAFTRKEDPTIGMHSPFTLTITLQ